MNCETFAMMKVTDPPLGAVSEWWWKSFWPTAGFLIDLCTAGGPSPPLPAAIRLEGRHSYLVPAALRLIQIRLD